MNHKLIILSIVALMFCAVLPMAPIMAVAVNNLAPDTTADRGNTVVSGNSPLRNLDAGRWDLLQIKAPDAWELAGSGQDVIVAVLDDGIDDTHPALTGKVIDRVSFTSGAVIDNNRGHGTHIAGLIAASIDQKGNSGIAYNAKLLDVRVAEKDGTSDALKVARGIIWAVDRGAQVINISIVISKPFTMLEDAVNYARGKGCLIVAAAGNDGSSIPVYPAGYPNVIAVSASDRSGLVAKWSNRGDWVAVAAPGVDIYSTLPGNQYGLRSGSSFSCALVSGCAALLFPRARDGNNDGLVNSEVADLLRSGSENTNDAAFPDRRINIYNAARAADIIRYMLPTDK